MPPLDSPAPGATPPVETPLTSKELADFSASYLVDAFRQKPRLVEVPFIIPAADVDEAVKAALVVLDKAVADGHLFAWQVVKATPTDAGDVRVRLIAQPWPTPAPGVPAVLTTPAGVVLDPSRPTTATLLPPGTSGAMSMPRAPDTVVMESVLGHKVAGADFALPIQGVLQKSAALALLAVLVVQWLESNVQAVSDFLPLMIRPYAPLLIGVAVWLIRHFFGGPGAQTVSAMAVYNSPAPVVPVSVKSDGSIVEVVKDPPPPVK